MGRRRGSVPRVALVSREEFEMRFRGQRGEAGQPGERGETGAAGPRLPRGVAYAVVFLFCFSVAGGALNLLWTSHVVSSQQAAARHAGQLVEQKLCSTFGRLAALRPPPGNPAANPSRAYLQAEHATLVQLGADIHCEGSR